MDAKPAQPLLTQRRPLTVAARAPTAVNGRGARSRARAMLCVQRAELRGGRAAGRFRWRKMVAPAALRVVRCGGRAMHGARAVFSVGARQAERWGAGAPARGPPAGSERPRGALTAFLPSQVLAVRLRGLREDVQRCHRGAGAAAARPQRPGDGRAARAAQPPAGGPGGSGPCEGGAARRTAGGRGLGRCAAGCAVRVSAWAGIVCDGSTERLRVLCLR